MIQADAYFFDIDGTLLNTRDLVHWNAMHQAMLEMFGIDTTIEGLAYHGKTDVAIPCGSSQWKQLISHVEAQATGDDPSDCNSRHQQVESSIPSALTKNFSDQEFMSGNPAPG